MGPVNKYHRFVSWFRLKLLQGTEQFHIFRTVDEWFGIYQQDNPCCKVSIHGFKRLIRRFHEDAIFASKMVKTRDRKVAYMFADKSILNLDEKCLRRKTYIATTTTTTTSSTSTIETNTRTSMSKSHISTSSLSLSILEQTSSTTDKTCNNLALLSTIASKQLDLSLVPTPVPCLQPSPFSKTTIQYIESSKHLDFEATTRSNILRPHLPAIRIHNCKSLSEGLKWHLLCLYMEHTEGKPELLKWKEKLELMRGIINNESYHNGYTKPIITCRTFARYIKSYKENKHTDKLFCVFTSRKGMNQVSYISFLDINFPRFLHRLYRYSIGVLGLDATVPQLIHCMNSRSRILHPMCPTRSDLKLTIHHFWNFFYSHGGQLKRPTTKPSLTEDQKKARVEWALTLKQSLAELDEFFYCYLDEKWFYTTSRRKKMKILPQAEWESSEEAKIVVPKVHSRRHCQKVMYMGIIGAPVYKRNEYGDYEYEIVDGTVKKVVLFDGKIMCKRVSRKVAQSQLSTHQNFVEEHILNDDIKKGEWKDLLVDPLSTSVSEALDIIGIHYGMDDCITDNLCFTYYTWKLVKKRKRKQPSSSSTTETEERVKQKVPIRITRDEIRILEDRMVTDEDMNQRLLTMEDLLLHVRVEKGTMVEKDCSCDSSFMIEHIHEIGRKIRKAYEKVTHKNKPIVLILDNAGGHGRNDVKKDYERVLREDYKIYVHWQIANSPETNLLDLGAWMALQSIVEKRHRLLILNKDILSKTVESGFLQLNDDVLTRIHDRWLRVLDLIIADKGNNDKVEQNRGLKQNPLSEESKRIEDLEEDVLMDEDEVSDGVVELG